MRTLLTLLLLSQPAFSATYYVRTDGKDSNDGTANDSSNAWRTIQHAENNVSAGDIIYLWSGTYDERVIFSGTAGTPENPIYLLTHPEAPNRAVFRGASVQASYWQFINLEVTHDDLGFTHAYSFANGSTAEGVEIHDNYIHDINGSGVRTGSDTTNFDDILIRGTEFYYMGYVSGFDTGGGLGLSFSGRGNSARWLFEYNTIRRATDFAKYNGSYGVFRNNVMSDFDNDHWSGVNDSNHSDFFQHGSNGTGLPAVPWRIFEANWLYDNVELNSHVWQFRDLSNVESDYYLFRGNVAFNIGSGSEYSGCDHGKWYNETYYDISNVSSAGRVMNFGNETASGLDSSEDNVMKNIIWHTVDGSSPSLINVDSGGSLDAANNIGYATVGDSSLVSTADPQLVDVANDDFRLSPSSTAALSTGVAITTITSATGSGTSFTVDDPYVLRDGGTDWHDYLEGDTITTEGGDTVQITGINYGTSTITVDSSISWTNGDDLFWGTDNTPDIGALPYDGGNDYKLTATISNSGSDYTVTVNDADICRMVVFYEGGIPQAPDYSTPYEYTSKGIGAGTVTAKAYHRYANSVPIVSATQADAPRAPTNLRTP